MDYKNKYLKYKNKYLELKNLLGGEYNSFEYKEICNQIDDIYNKKLIFLGKKTKI